jgi:hypothetical protein
VSWVTIARPKVGLFSISLKSLSKYAWGENFTYDNALPYDSTWYGQTFIKTLYYTAYHKIKCSENK